VFRCTRRGISEGFGWVLSVRGSRVEAPSWRVNWRSVAEFAGLLLCLDLVPVFTYY
jgi:hypothetical protein